MKITKKIKAAILKNEDPFDHEPWVIACEAYSSFFDYKIIDLTKFNWFCDIQNFKPDILLLKPSGKTSIFRTLYQERLEILTRDLNYQTLPTYDEVRIYENKRFFAYWASANQLPHPATWVFYSKKESVEFSKSCNFPVVTKQNIGASGNGVQIINNRKELISYINNAFTKGVSSNTGPNLNKGKIFTRLLSKLLHPKQLINRLSTYSQIAADKQKGFVLIQQFIPHNFEWRVVRIGDSFFAHKKLKVGEKASGTLKKGYENPPIKLFKFVNEVTERFNFRSVAVDIFEDNADNYLINEIQCIFGQSDPYQMLVDGIPGRYRLIDEKWIFEPGDYNQNQSYNLRLEFLLQNHF